MQFHCISRLKKYHMGPDGSRGAWQIVISYNSYIILTMAFCPLIHHITSNVYTLWIASRSYRSQQKCMKIVLFAKFVRPFWMAEIFWFLTNKSIGTRFFIILCTPLSEIRGHYAVNCLSFRNNKTFIVQLWIY